MKKYRVCISTGDSGTLPFMLIAEASLMLMVLGMMIITMKMMLLMMIMTNQNDTSESAIETARGNKRSGRVTAWRGGETTIPRQRLGSPLAHLGHSSLDSVMST